jgi:hypothetical protein
MGTSGARRPSPWSAQRFERVLGFCTEELRLFPRCEVTVLVRRFVTNELVIAPQTSLMATSTLPRIALEYVQICSAASTTA